MQSPLKCRLVNSSGAVHEVLVGRPRGQRLPLLQVLGKLQVGPFGRSPPDGSWREKARRQVATERRKDQVREQGGQHALSTSAGFSVKAGCVFHGLPSGCQRDVHRWLVSSRMCLGRMSSDASMSPFSEQRKGQMQRPL